MEPDVRVTGHGSPGQRKNPDPVPSFGLSYRRESAVYSSVQSCSTAVALIGLYRLQYIVRFTAKQRLRYKLVLYCIVLYCIALYCIVKRE